MGPHLRFGELAHRAAEDLLLFAWAKVHSRDYSGQRPSQQFWYAVGMRRFCLLTSVSCLLLLLSAAPAAADITAFYGVNATPSEAKRAVRGLALGTGLIIVAFEAEYADTKEDLTLGGPRLRTFMFNGLVQTPVPIAGMQFYATAGGGGYRESFETVPEVSETNVAINVGGGAKISIAGPLRLRLDYRVFTLKGTPRHEHVQRFYAGVNLKF
jgi:hypothetical protein